MSTPINQTGKIFGPQVAGMFYPSDRNDLTTMIRGFLEQAKSSISSVKHKPFGIIVPHAGYPYSGPVASVAYKALSNQKYKHVVVLAPAHRQSYSVPALLDQLAYRTPLGNMPIDGKMVRAIAETKTALIDNTRFSGEHALEVELPFLQMVLNDTKLVPIMISRPDPDGMKKLAQTLAKLFNANDTLYVASTDMSHDHPYDVAVALDKNALNYIKRIDVEGLYRANQAYYRRSSEISLRSDGSLSVDCTQLCGLGPVMVLLELAKMQTDAMVTILDRRNSGDIVGDTQSRIVGYFSAAITSKTPKSTSKGGNSKPSQNDFLSSEQKKTLLSMARKTIETYLENRKIMDFTPSSAQLKKPAAAFVTLKKGNALRGCIGHMEPHQPLWEMVRDRALDAALHDPRFQPVKKPELKDLHIEISVLSPRIQVKNPLKEIEIGRDGVWLELGGHRGVFLPQVPVEQGWKSVEEYLDHLCRKAHIFESGCWKNPEARISRFTALVFSE